MSRASRMSDLVPRKYCRTSQAGTSARNVLAGFFVGRVAGAPAAVLLELDPVPIVVPVLLRDVVATLALAALERHADPLVAGQVLTSVAEISLS